MEWRLNHVGQMAQSVQDYSDATQGTFMKAMKKLKDYFELHIK